MVGKGVTRLQIRVWRYLEYLCLYNGLVSVLRRLWTHLVFLTSS